MTDLPFNPKDPMRDTGPEQEKNLFDAFRRASNGHDHAVVVGAAMNLLVNAVRQNCATRNEAQRMYDELVGRSKNLLMEQHYDPVSGKRRNIFPFTQHVHAQPVKF